MPTPSLLIVPARFKSGKLYSQIPTSGAGDFTVTRATTATRVNASGLIESVASGIPRLDYFASDGTVGCPALLVEPSGSNLAKYSEQFDTVTSGWTPTALQTITGNTNATLDPAGGNTADLIVATTGTTTHNIRPNSNNLPAFVSGTTYTYSVFAKATSATSGFVQIYLGDIVFSPVGPYANFQLSGNGAVTTGTYSAASIQPFGNGWYRCSITATAAANGVATAPFMPILASGTARAGTFAGNGVDGVYLWGAQLETGSVATSYIPTTTAAVTRNADVVSVAGVSSLLGQTSGTFYLDASYSTKGSTGTGIWVYIQGTPTTNNIGLAVASNTVRSVVNSQSDVLPTPSTVDGVKVAWAYDENGVVCFVNGVQYALSNGGAQIITSMNRLTIDMSSASGIRLADTRFRAISCYQTRLSNAELAALTSL